MSDLIRVLLEDEFETIREIQDGDEALKEFTELHPDWVIMDIQMKRLDGISTTSLLKMKYPEAKIIILTNYPDGELRAAAQKAGALGYVLKENISEVRQIIRNMKSG